MEEFLDTPTLEQTAKRLKLDASTVSRNLKRGYYWQLSETVKVAGSLIERTFLLVVRKRTRTEPVQNHANALSSLSGDLPGPLLSDFVFQTARLVEQKRRGKAAGYLLHGGSLFLRRHHHWLCPAGFHSLAANTLRDSRLTLVHLLIDLAKIQLARKYPFGDGSWAYVSDQLAHFLTVGLAAWLLSPALPFGELSAFIQIPGPYRTSFSPCRWST